MALVDRPPSPYTKPIPPAPKLSRDAWVGCLEAIWIRSSNLQCEAKGDHEIHFCQVGKHIVRWWGPIGATKIDPPQFIFSD